MVNLKEAGIGEGVSEVIVTTQSASGTPNAAPVGILTEIAEEKELHYFVKLYRGSQTLANVLETHTLAANVTDDAVLFVQAAFDKLSEDYFTVFAGIPVLTAANAWIVFESMLAEEHDEYFRFRITPKTVKINRKELKAINRGLNAVIEAAILETRYNITKDEKEKEAMRMHMGLYIEIVEKCGGSREKEAMRILFDKCKGFLRM